MTFGFYSGYLKKVYEDIVEQIVVVAVFKNGHALPRSFTWHNREYRVEQVNLVHEEKHGGDLIFCFALTADGNSYELSFNSHRLVWTLEKVWSST